MFAPAGPKGGGRRHAPPPPIASGGGGAGFTASLTTPILDATVTEPMQSSISGELSLRHMPDGRVVITHEAHGEMGCEGDVDAEGFCVEAAPSQVRYHVSDMDAFGPTHYGPGTFGIDSMHQDIDTAGMPCGPAEFGLDEFGLDETFYPYGYGLSMIFGDEGDTDVGCIKG
jgi:hypothetical protein